MTVHSKTRVNDDIIFTVAMEEEHVTLHFSCNRSRIFGVYRKRTPMFCGSRFCQVLKF